MALSGALSAGIRLTPEAIAEKERVDREKKSNLPSVIAGAKTDETPTGGGMTATQLQQGKTSLPNVPSNMTPISQQSAPVDPPPSTAPEAPPSTAPEAPPPSVPQAPPPADIPSTVQPAEQIDTSAIVGRMSAKAGAQAAQAAQAAGLNPALAAMQGATASANKYTDAFFDQQKLRQAELAQKQQAEQFAITAGQQGQQISNDMTKFYENMGLTREQMAQAQKQFEITAGMTQQQIDNQAEQFADQLGLTKEQWLESKRQWEAENVRAQEKHQTDQENALWDRVIGTGTGILGAIIPG